MKKKLHTLTDGLRWSSFALLLAAGIINAIGVTMFLAPVHLYDSGISGTSMLLWQITPERYTLSLFLLLLNTPLFLFGWRLKGFFTDYWNSMDIAPNWQAFTQEPKPRQPKRQSRGPAATLVAERQSCTPTYSKRFFAASPPLQRTKAT